MSESTYGADDGDDSSDRMEVVCLDCGFRETIRVDADRKPADIVVNHGKETGHTLSISRDDGEASGE